MPLSSRTSSYGVSGSDTCWVHRALSVPRDLPMSRCVSAGALGYVKHPHIWLRSNFLYAAVLSENWYTRIFNLNLSVDGNYTASAVSGCLCCTLLEAICRRQHGCFWRRRASKCLDYSGIHLYNACDNGIKPLLWEKSVWRMDYAKALPMGCWTQELSQAVSISSGCISSEKLLWCSISCPHAILQRNNRRQAGHTCVCFGW